MSDEIVLDRVIPVFPESLDIVTNVAVLISDDDTQDSEDTYLIVIKPTPVRRPMSTHSCQNSDLLKSASPVISIHDLVDFLLAASSSPSMMSPGPEDKRDEVSVDGRSCSSSAARSGWQVTGGKRRWERKGLLTDFLLWESR
jgi:hypothetical protein